MSPLITTQIFFHMLRASYVPVSLLSVLGAFSCLIHDE